MSWTKAFASIPSLPFSSPVNSLAFVGIVIVSYFAVSAILFAVENFRVFVLARTFPGLFGLNLKTFGLWAVVTGATDGIGKEYAIQLARDHRLNVVLISRSMDKLKRVAIEIGSYAPGIEIKCVAVDFTDGFDIYSKIETELESLDIAVLVNNVGDMGCTEDMTYFYETRRSRNFRNIIWVNCGATVFMTQIVLPRMVAKNKGVIINLSSAAAKLQGLPFLSVYSGTKAFVNNFIRSLERECHGTGVIFQTVCPLSVATKMNGMKPSMTVCDTKTVVRSSIAAVGLQSLTFGCLTHNLMGLLLEFLDSLPSAISGPITMASVKNILKARRAYDQAENDSTKNK